MPVLCGKAIERRQTCSDTANCDPALRRAVLVEEND